MAGRRRTFRRPQRPFFWAENEYYDNGLVARMGPHCWAVLTYLFRIAREVDEQLLPSLADVQDATGLSRKGVILCLRKLDALGEVRRIALGPREVAYQIVSPVARHGQRGGRDSVPGTPGDSEPGTPSRTPPLVNGVHQGGVPGTLPFGPPHTPPNTQTTANAEIAAADSAAPAAENPAATADETTLAESTEVAGGGIGDGGDGVGSGGCVELLVGLGIDRPAAVEAERASRNRSRTTWQQAVDARDQAKLMQGRGELKTTVAGYVIAALRGHYPVSEELRLARANGGVDPREAAAARVQKAKAESASRAQALAAERRMAAESTRSQIARLEEVQDPELIEEIYQRAIEGAPELVRSALHCRPREMWRESPTLVRLMAAELEKRG